MTKNLFVKGILKGELQICGYCEYWGLYEEYKLKATCRQTKVMKSSFDECSSWKWNGQIDKSKEPVA